MLSLRHVGPGSLDPLGRVGAEQSGAAKHGFGAATLSATGDQPCRFSFIDFRRLTSPVALNARARAFPKISRAGAAGFDAARAAGGAAAAGGGRDALSYRVSFATARSHQLAAEGSGHAFSPAFRPWFS